MSRRATLFRAIIIVGFPGVAACTYPQETPPDAMAFIQENRSAEGMVVAAQPLAAAAGAQILRAGGNAADAAVAAAFAISVVEPTMNSIAGRTQILLRRPDGSFAGIDATTEAPSTYDPDTAPQASYGYPTVGVPGAVAGLVRLLDDHGTMDLAQVMAPAIELAREGFRILPGDARRQAAGSEQIAEFEGSRAHFLNEDGTSMAAGDLFVQTDLAETLQQIAEGGRDAFYEGAIAQRMVDDLSAKGSAVTMASLADYEAEDAAVVRGSYRGFELVGTDAPASGALSIGILHILENFDMAALEPAQWAAVVGQAMTLGFAHRSMLGAGPFGAVLTDKDWARDRAMEIEVGDVAPPRALARALPQALPPAAQMEEAPEQSTVLALDHDWTGDTWGEHSTHTTHLSTADGAGMFVSLTQTIGPNMGSKVVTPGLGFLHAATLGGYLGRIEPGERARSSISPLMLLSDGEPVLVLGAAGGARIVSAVVQAVLRHVDHQMPLPEALAAARVHPVVDGIAMETSPGIGWTSAQAESVRGWGMEVDEVVRTGAFGRIHGIFFDAATGELTGVADPDWEGAAVAPSDVQASR